MENKSGDKAGSKRQWHPTPVLAPGESHGQRSLAGDSPRDTHTHTHTLRHTHTHTDTQTHTQTYTDTHTHRHIHTHLK